MWVCLQGHAGDGEYKDFIRSPKTWLVTMMMMMTMVVLMMILFDTPDRVGYAVPSLEGRQISLRSPLLQCASTPASYL